MTAQRELLVLIAVIAFALPASANAKPASSATTQLHPLASAMPSPTAAPSAPTCDESCYPTGATKRPSWNSYLDSYNGAKAKYTKAYWDAQGRLAVASVSPYEEQGTRDPYILLVVVIIVLTGVMLSVLQFFKGPLYARAISSAPTGSGDASEKRIGDVVPLDRSNEQNISEKRNGNAVPKDPSKEGTNDPSVSTVKLSLKGLEIQSASIGLLVLSLSIAFFYLYLIYVYQIHPTK